MTLNVYNFYLSFNNMIFCIRGFRWKQTTKQTMKGSMLEVLTCFHYIKKESSISVQYTDNDIVLVCHLSMTWLTVMTLYFSSRPNLTITLFSEVFYTPEHSSEHSDSLYFDRHLLEPTESVTIIRYNHIYLFPLFHLLWLIFESLYLSVKWLFITLQV